MNDVTKASVQLAAEQIKGGATLAEASKSLDLPYGSLQKALKQTFGKDGYTVLMANVTRRPFGGGAAVVMDDSKVPVIKKMPLKDGWKVEMITVRHRREEVFISPEGKRYVRAQGNEKADLIADATAKKLGRMRLRIEKGSALSRKVHREEKLVQAGEEQRERRAGFEPADSLKRTKKVRRKR